MARRMGFFARLFFTYKLFIRVVVLGSLGWGAYWLIGDILQPVTIGVLFPLSGSKGTTGMVARDGAQFAVDQINAQGGLLRRQVKMVPLDINQGVGRPQEKVAALLSKYEIDTIVGCLEPHCRRELYDVISAQGGLLVYPYSLEGLSVNPRAIETGALPNQLLRPGTEWAMEKFGKRVYLVLPQNLYGRVSEVVLRHAVESAGGKVIGHIFMDNDVEQGEAAARVIAENHPDVILNVFIGESNISLYKTLDAIVPRSDRIPSLFFRASKPELSDMGWESVAGSYVIGDYFAEMQSPMNTDFKAAYASKFGENAVPGPGFVAAYSSVMIWAGAVRKAGSAAPDAVLAALPGLRQETPAGLVSLSHQSNHILHTPMVAEIKRSGALNVVWTAPAPIHPQNYDLAMTVQEWDRFLADLYQEWQNQWAPPK